VRIGPLLCLSFRAFFFRISNLKEEEGQFLKHKSESSMGLIHKIQAYFFDLDGCIYFNNAISPGARAIVQRLKEADKQVFYLTNNSRQTAAEIAIKLQNMGLLVRASDILAVTDYVGRYLNEHYGILRVHVAGSSSLCNALKSSGHEIITAASGDAADAVVVGLDTDFTYDKLACLSRAIGCGAKLIAANADLSHPGEGETKVPETGALIAAIEAVTGVRAEYVGKPEQYLFLSGMEASGVLPENSAMIGDNYNTDIIGGKRVGMYTVWLSGLAKSSREDLASKTPAADLIVEHLSEFNNLLGG
jgi:HAD superfamily hydrolase (TIGR01450 family)